MAVSEMRLLDSGADDRIMIDNDNDQYLHIVRSTVNKCWVAIHGSLRGDCILGAMISEDSQEMRDFLSRIIDLEFFEVNLFDMDLPGNSLLYEPPLEDSQSYDY